MNSRRKLRISTETLYQYWQRGFDTAAIAKFCHMEESHVYNILSAHRETFIAKEDGNVHSSLGALEVVAESSRCGSHRYAVETCLHIA